MKPGIKFQIPCNIPPIFSAVTGFGWTPLDSESKDYNNLDVSGQCWILKWCPGAESNHRHEDFQSTALPLSYPGTGNGGAVRVEAF